MKVRHLHETDKQYRVFLYIFYAAASMMGIIMVYGVVMMVGEWQETGYYVMGEVLVNTHVPFDNFANLTTWLSFACVISWYCVSRIGWKKTVGSFTVLNAEITAQMVIDGTTPDIDRLIVDYPDPDRPWNLIFATKIWSVGFLISAHAFYLSTRPRKSKEEMIPDE